MEQYKQSGIKGDKESFSLRHLESGWVKGAANERPTQKLLKTIREVNNISTKTRPWKIS